MRIRLCWSALSLSVLSACFAAAADNQPLSVVERGKAATALLLAGRGSATAFCIDPSGYFVTNYHAMRRLGTGESVRLVLRPGAHDQKICVAKLVRADSESDLAILRVVDPAELIALELGDTSGLEETQRVAAFGYPFGELLAFGEGQYPSISVNGGSVTSLRKQDGRLEAIQVDIALNPGNSGGPVVERAGRVVGVVRAGIPGSGVNFVVPVEKLKAVLAVPDVAFEPPPISRDAAARETRFRARPVWLLKEKEMPLQMQLEIRASDEPVRRLDMQTSEEGFEVAAVPVPSASGPMKIQLTAEFELGVVRGLVADNSFQVGTETVWLRELESLALGGTPQAILRRTPRQVSGSVGGLGTTQVDVGGQQVSVDLSKAKLLRVDRPRTVDSLTVSVIARQDGKEVARRTFTIRLDGGVQEAGQALVSSRPLEPVTTPRPRRITSGLLPGQPNLPEAPKMTIPVAPEEAVPIVAPKLTGEVQTCQLAGAINDVAVGGGGRFLVLHLGQLRKLAIFDVNEMRIANYAALAEDNIRFAAGNSKLLVVLCDSRVLQRWDLTTGQREVAAPLPVEGVVKSVSMGAASGGPLLVHWAVGTGALDHAQFDLVDIESLKSHHVAAQGAGHRGTSYRDQTQIRASDDGRTFGMWEQGVSPGGLQVLVLGESSARSFYEHETVGHVVPSSDGRFICTSSGIFSQELRRLDRPGGPATMAVPSHGGGFFLRGALPDLFSSRETVPTVTLSVYMESDLGQPIATIPNLDILPPRTDYGGSQTLPIDKRVHLVPAAQMLVTIPGTNDRLVAQRFDLEEALDKLGVDYLFVTSTPPTHVKSGSQFEYAVGVKSKKGGVTYRLDSAPDGMNVSPTGVITWNVPTDMATGSVSVILSVKDASAQERLHSFPLKIER
jgi:hypothetical protein